MYKVGFLRKGFTIVELLIVIVVIAILAALVIVSYSNITSRAKEASLKSDISATAKKVSMYRVENGTYPVSLDSSTRVQSSGTTLTYTSSGSNFCIQAKASEGSQLSFSMTNEGVIKSGDCMITALSISGGANFQCFYGSNEIPYCWGYGAGGRLGTGSTATISTPGAIAKGSVPGSLAMKSIATGAAHACGIDSAATAYCWGYNGNGRLGDGSTADRNAPTTVARGAMPVGVSAIAISPGNGASCLLGSDNKVYCWGANNYGQLGNGTAVGSLTPVALSQGAIPSGAQIRSLAMAGADDHACVVTSSDRGYCWGRNALGQLGNSLTTDSNVPVEVSRGEIPTGVSIKSISLGTNQSCAIGSDDWAYCWGNNGSGQLGDGSVTFRNAPVAVARGAIPADVKISSISTRSGRTCAIGSDKKAYCWGYGAIGSESTMQSLVPIAVSMGVIPANLALVAVTTGDQHTCFLGSDAQVYCMGRSNYGQLGNGSMDASGNYVRTPIPVTMPVL